jgi:hypothetical protein
MNRGGVRDLVQLVLAWRHDTRCTARLLEVLLVKKVACLDSARFGIEPGDGDSHVQLGARVREVAANGTLEPGIFDRGAQLAWLGGRRDDETLDEEVRCVVPLALLLLLLQSKLAGGRQGALQLGERDTAASVVVAASATAGADDERGEEQQADKRACPQSPPVSSPPVETPAWQERRRSAAHHLRRPA